MITKHLSTFGHVIKDDRAANTSTAAAYIDGLAAIAALTIAGGYGSKDEIKLAIVGKLSEAIDRDLKHLKAVK